MILLPINLIFFFDDFIVLGDGVFFFCILLFDCLNISINVNRDFKIEKIDNFTKRKVHTNNMVFISLFFSSIIARLI